MKAQGDAINAIAFASRWRPIIENMAKMATTAPAMDLGAGTGELVVEAHANGAGQRLPKTWPACPAVIFCGRCEKRQIAASAMIGAPALFAMERTRKRPLRGLMAQGRIGGGGEALPPRLIAQDKFKTARRVR